MTIKAKKSKINLREKLAELLNFRQIRDRLDGLGLYLGKDRTGTAENMSVRGGASIDDLQLAEISTALGGTAVDIFVYDTRNDSDGGKWRERTQNTSWYNEELNTATRGGRREFPAVAVIVTEASKVTIYDGDDPDFNMWMVFEATQSGYTTMLRAGAITSLSMLNGEFWVSHQNGGGVHWINFLKDTARWITQSTGYGGYFKAGTIDKRNTSTVGNYDQNVPGASNIVIVSPDCNDIAMTVLPNAPIDDDTGLPIPTIAVATDDGVSVIKDDGSVVDIVSDNLNAEAPLEVNFRGQLLYMLLGSEENISNTWNNVSTIYIPDNDVSTTYRFPGDYVAQYFRYNGLPASEPANSGHDMLVPINSQTHLPLAQRSRAINVLGTDHLYIGGEGYEDKAGGVAAISENLTNPKHGLLTYTTSTYNTGWMPGDIKLATLSDTKIETVGVDETSNLITNSTFVDTNSDGADDWTLANGASTSTSSGVVTITNTATNYGYIYQVISTEIGKRYQFSVDVDYTADAGRVLLGKDGAGTSADVYLNQEAISSDKTVQYYFTAETENLYVRIGLNNNTSGESISYSNISVTETGELITNGTFDNGTEGWTAETGWTIGTGVASCDGTNYVTLTQDNVLSGGVKYILTFDVSSYTSGNVEARWYDSGWTTIGSAVSAVGTHAFTFTPGQNTNGGLTFRSGSFVGSIDNISVRLAEPDRSVNDNGLQIFGEITKSPVAPGADLVAYSGFSADDYLMQPYNPDLDFGTGDFCIMGWVRGTAGAGWLDWSDLSVSGSRISFYSLSPLVFKTYDQVSTATCTASKNINDNTWHHIVAKRGGNELYIYIDGVLSSDIPESVQNLSNTSAVLKLGVNVYNSQSLNSGDALALWRISKTAPTPEQIAKIYRDEKPLFQDGAQATLYGTSDAVTALSYDDKTELLYVGTSGGRSDFAGLRRINNTTTAVTTSISASNNLIAEQ